MPTDTDQGGEALYHQCLNPVRLIVMPEGTAKKKDGSPGHRVLYNRAVNPSFTCSDVNGEVPNVYDSVPCGKCINCRRNAGRVWTERLTIESKQWSQDEQIFLTLTYDEEKVPIIKYRPTLNYPDVQAFLKRLRKNTGINGMKFFCSGEYGDHTERPHYHMILFGYDPWLQSYQVGKSESGSYLYENRLISEAWKNGIANFGYVDAASIAYVAQYASKKLVQEWNSDDVRTPPFIQMSRRPGIATNYIREHTQQIEDGTAYINGRQVSISRYIKRIINYSNSAIAARLIEQRNAAEHMQNAQRELHINYDDIVRHEAEAYRKKIKRST